MSKKKQKAPVESWHSSSNPLSVLEYNERGSWKKKHGKKTPTPKSGSKILKNQAKKVRAQQKDHRPLKVTKKIKVFSGGLPSLGKKK